MAEPFLKLPSKRFNPSYFKEIRNPISLFLIRQKLCVSCLYEILLTRLFIRVLAFYQISFQNGHYGTVSEVAGDLNILFENTKKFNKPDSKLYKVALLKFVIIVQFFFRTK